MFDLRRCQRLEEGLVWEQRRTRKHLERQHLREEPVLLSKEQAGWGGLNGVWTSINQVCLPGLSLGSLKWVSFVPLLGVEMGLRPTAKCTETCRLILQFPSDTSEGPDRFGDKQAHPVYTSSITQVHCLKPRLGSLIWTVQVQVIPLLFLLPAVIQGPSSLFLWQPLK